MRRLLVVLIIAFCLLCMMGCTTTRTQTGGNEQYEYHYLCRWVDSGTQDSIRFCSHEKVFKTAK